MKINSHGFGDKEHTCEKKKGFYRILVLGDFCTQALQVPLEQSFPYVLEERLNSKSNITKLCPKAPICSGG